MTRPSLRTILIGVLIVLVLLAGLGWKSGCDAAKSARADHTQAAATGAALDNVARETPIIRQDQEEKQREVEQIPGADQRLPDGFGRDLERVRRGGRDSHS